MDKHRRTAIAVGVLFIIGTVAGILTLGAGAILDDPDYLNKVAANESQIIRGALFILLMGFSLSMMSVVLFPILKKHNETLALGAVVFRGALEAIVNIAIVVSWLLLLFLSQEYVQAAAQDASNFQALGTLLQEARNGIYHMLDIVFSLGALMIYYVFYQSKLIPRWLSGWGFIGGILYLAVPLFALFGSEIDTLYYPLAVQEMVMAVWLIVKGFNPSAIDLESD